MKKILVAALLLTAPGFAMAQKTGDRRIPLTPQQRAEKHTERVGAIVSLTPEQRVKIAAENLRSAEAMQPHVDAVRKERRAMREIGKQRRQAYATILTPDQMERLKSAHENNRKSGKAHGEHVRPNRRAEMRTDAPNK